MKVIVENIKMMQKRHKEEIKDLQDLCPHREVSDWMEYHWAIGHFSHHVKVCTFCGIIVSEKHPEYVSLENAEVKENGRCLVEV